MKGINMGNDFILVLDFGGAQAQSMARKLRGQNYYCEVQSCSIDIETVRLKAPRGLLLAGGPSDRPFDEDILRLGIPVLALGSCSRSMIKAFGASCEGALLTDRASQITFLPCPLFEGLGESDRYFDRIDALRLPDGFEPIATTIEGLMPAFANSEVNIYGLQFYAESNDPDGSRILANFAGNICSCPAYWYPEVFIDREVEYIRSKIGDGKAIMALSGGVDSTVCAMLMRRAIGDRLKCVFVDTGLLRKGEVETVAHTFRDQLGLDLVIADARERVLRALSGVTDPREKRRIIHEEFIRTMQEEASSYAGAEFLVEGTIYSDLLSGTVSESGYAQRLETLKRIEPIRMLFKEEVRFVGETLGVPKELISQQPFPGSGLAIRCIGEVTAEKLFLLREADAIFRAEIVESGLDRRLSQYFAILTDVQTIGMRDGKPCTEQAVALRAVNTTDTTGVTIAKLPYDLIERVVQRITSQVPGINRVLYDVTGKPSSMAEWE